MGGGQGHQFGPGQGLDQPLAQRHELGIVVAGQHQHRHRQLTQARPQRLLVAGATSAQGGGETLGAVVEPSRQTGRGVGQPGEQRVGQPMGDETLKAVIEQSSGQDLVGLPAGQATFHLVDPGGGSDQHQPGNQTRMLQGGVQRGPTPHRVPDIDPMAANLTQQSAGGGEIGFVVVGWGPAMAGKVDHHHLVIGGQVVPEWAPTTEVLGEAVGQNQPPAPTPVLMVQAHHPRMAATSRFQTAILRRPTPGSLWPVAIANHPWAGRHDRWWATLEKPSTPNPNPNPNPARTRLQGLPLTVPLPTTTPNDDVVARAERLTPLVRRHADWSEEHRRQAPEVARALAEAGLHRCGVPKSLGGLGCDPMSMMRVIETVSGADGGAGWTVMIGIEVLGVASGYLPADTVRSLLAAQPATIAAGAVNPVGRAVPTDGGYLVNGRWPFASGIHNADWWWGGCVVDDGTGRRPRDTIQVLVPHEQVTIVDTWHVAGLAGSGSHDVEVVDRFVPHAHVSTMPGPPAMTDEPIFRMPIMARFAFNKVGVATGIARSAVEAFKLLAAEKTPRGERNSLAERPRAQSAVAQAEARLSSGRAWAFEVVEELWAAALEGRPVSPDLHARVRLSCSYAVESSVRAVELVHSAAGSTVNFRSSPLERQFRDVHVVPQQITVAPHLMDAAGRVLLGLDPGHSTF